MRLRVEKRGKRNMSSCILGVNVMSDGGGEDVVWMDIVIWEDESERRKSEVRRSAV